MNINVDGSVTFSVAEWFEYRHEIAQISERVTSAEELAAFLGRFTRGDPPPAPLADVDLINEMSGEVAAELDALSQEIGEYAAEWRAGTPNGMQAPGVDLIAWAERATDLAARLRGARIEDWEAEE